jgi:hypothetical protein
VVVKFIISSVLSQSNRASNQQDIEDILIKRRAFIKNNPIRTVLMIMIQYVFIKHRKLRRQVRQSMRWKTVPSASALLPLFEEKGILIDNYLRPFQNYFVSA